MAAENLSHFVNTTIAFMVVYCFLCVLFLLVYSYLFYDFGILCWTQIQGYILVYVVCFVDIIAGYLGIQALKKGRYSFYSDYTTSMALFIFSTFLNLFSYVAFVNSLFRKDMLLYLQEYFGRYDDVPDILRDLQFHGSCCGILGYKDYPTFSNSSGTYYRVSDSCCRTVQEGCSLFSNKTSLSKLNESIYTTPCTKSYVPTSDPRDFVMEFTEKAQMVYCCPYMLLCLKMVILGFYRHSMLDNIISDLPTITVNYDDGIEEPRIMTRIIVEGQDPAESDSSTMLSNILVTVSSAHSIVDNKSSSIGSVGRKGRNKNKRRKSRKDKSYSEGCGDRTKGPTPVEQPQVDVQVEIMPPSTLQEALSRSQ